MGAARGAQAFLQCGLILRKTTACARPSRWIFLSFSRKLPRLSVTGYGILAVALQAFAASIGGSRRWKSPDCARSVFDLWMPIRLLLSE